MSRQRNKPKKYPIRVRWDLIKNVAIHFRTLPRRCHGLIDDDNVGTIDVWIDLQKRVLPARILLHELLHYQFPDTSETRIRSMECAVWRRLTQKQKYRLYRRLFLRRWRV